MQIFNTLSRQKEDFHSIERGEVKIYSCGPTVYDYPHIGNLRAFIFSDTLRRAFEFLGFHVIQVVNITDVGHLVSDENEGEDKMEKAAKREKKDPFQIARYYEDEFRKNLKAFNIKTPHVLPRATEHIEAQINLIQKLFKNGYAYILDDGVYFDVSKFEKYGQLSRQDLEEKQSGARVKVRDQKHNPEDFALWKFLVGENTNHIMQWDSPWKNTDGVSKGFPGWHIECSAMSMQYLGKTFDIHTGGVDHIPVHHENEIAQSEGATGQKFVNYWMHNNFLQIDGGKMSKSKGNAYTLQEIVKKEFLPLDFRYFCLSAHYRAKLNFTWEALEGAHNAMKKLNDKIVKLKNSVEKKQENPKLYQTYLEKFQKAIEDDLNTPQAMAVLWDSLKDSKLSNNEKLNLVLRFDQVLGLGLREITDERIEQEIPAKITELAEKREEMRKNKKWAEADELRNQIFKQGYEVLDEERGYRVKEL